MHAFVRSLAALLISIPPVACATAGPAASASAHATSSSSTAGPSRMYRFDFVLASKNDSDGNLTRAYSMNVEEHSQGWIRSGDNEALPGGARTDTGISLRCHYDIADSDLVLHANVELSSIGESRLIKKMSAEGDAFVLPGKPTMIAMLEDPKTHAEYDLSVTATRLR